MATMARADIYAKKKALRERLSASESLKSRGTLGAAMSVTDRALLDRAIEIKKDSVASNRPLTKEERKEVRQGERTVGQQITIKNDRVKFISQTTAGNFEVRDSALRVKKEALKTHLNTVEARKTDYKIVKGIKPKEPTKIPAKATLKSASREFESFVKKNTANGNDTGLQAVGMMYGTAKALLIADSKLTAINKGLVKGSVKVVDGGIQIGKKTYIVGKTLYGALRAGNMVGTLNMYKNMTLLKIGRAIKYSSPVHHVRSVYEGAKTIAWSTAYRAQRSIKLVRGVRNGTIRITAREATKYVGAKTVGVGKTVYKVGKGIGRLHNTRIVRGSLKGVHTSLKSISNQGKDDMAVQAVGAMADSVRYSYQALKMTGRTAKTTAKVAKGTVNGVYRTGRGTYRFVKDARKLGVKSASKLWYKAHLKGAGKRLGEKISGKIAKVMQELLKKAMFNPAVLMAVGILLCTVIIGNTAVVSASSVAGGVIEFFEELKEGLQEVWDTVTSKIAEFFSNCVEWLKNLFTGGSSEPAAPEVDVDIGDNMSICDYLLGAVQLYKAEFSLEVQEEAEKLLTEEGYHAVILYHEFDGGQSQLSLDNPEAALMSDKSYVRAILPVWKSIILGTIGTGFTGRQANDVSKECFETLTEMEKVPVADINHDGVSDYSFCDGSSSLTEGGNTVYTYVYGDASYPGGMSCLNESAVMTHSSHNTEGLGCCVTEYYCGGHLKYTCNGHPTTTTCSNVSSCSNPTTDYPTCGTDHCSNWVPGFNLFGHEFGGHCGGHPVTVCGGHPSTTYCWPGWAESAGSCSNASSTTVYCYPGRKEEPGSCTNEQSAFSCGGYKMCLGHKVMEIHLGNNGFQELLEEKFLNRISELEAIPARSAAENQELSQLKMFYEYAVKVEESGDPIADEFFSSP